MTLTNQGASDIVTGAADPQSIMPLRPQQTG